MQTPTYKTSRFGYSPERRTFYGKEETLTVEGYKYPFPNQGKKFRIMNPWTKGFRVVKLDRETDTHFTFVSEDLIWVEIEKARN